MAEEELDEWTVKANNVFNVNLVTKTTEKSPKTIERFPPLYTYPIFERDEEIRGYKGLKINLHFNASDMRPHLSHTSSKRMPGMLGEEPDNIVELCRPFLPPVAFESKADFDIAVQNTPDDWRPPGELIYTSEGDSDGQYEVWKGSLADPAVLQLVKRIQILASLYIEGGTHIRTESTDEYEADPLDRWTVLFLYQKRLRSDKSDQFYYVFAGYSTIYRLYHFQPPAAAGSAATSGDFELPKEALPFSDFPCRWRISQFIILPPFQHNGNAQRLYGTIYRTYLDDPMTYEITVEDPNEAFDAVRDLADLAFLRRQPDFNEIRINTSVQISKTGFVPADIVDKTALEAIRLKYKIAPRQFKRLVELNLMSKLPDSVRPAIKSESERAETTAKKAAKPEEEREYKLWRLLAKSRIYAQNKEVMSALEPNERIDKLNETLVSVELEHVLRLSSFAQQIEKQQRTASKKRKLDDGEEAANGKKARVVEA